MSKDYKISGLTQGGKDLPKNWEKLIKLCARVYQAAYLVQFGPEETPTIEECVKEVIAMMNDGIKKHGTITAGGVLLNTCLNTVEGLQECNEADDEEDTCENCGKLFNTKDGKCINDDDNWRLA